MRISTYVAASLVAAFAVVYHAFWYDPYPLYHETLILSMTEKTREQFYPSILYMSTSKVSVVVLGNFALALATTAYALGRKIFFGSLREAEVERLVDKGKDAVMETCLAMTIFRQEFNLSFVALFTGLLFLKIFHWLAQDRVEYAETTPNVTLTSHLRVVMLMVLLLAADFVFLKQALVSTMNDGPSVLLLFAFEYIILTTLTVSGLVRYLFFLIDASNDGGWEGKGVAVFYLGLIVDLVQLMVYFLFFLVIFAYYGLPLHLIRDLYITFHNFRGRVRDFIHYRRVTRNMKERFREATAEELERESTCIVCREEMSVGASGRNSPKVLPCGHVFHLGCLRAWLERQQACPTCRAPVVENTTREERGGEGRRGEERRREEEEEEQGRRAGGIEENGEGVGAGQAAPRGGQGLPEGERGAALGVLRGDGNMSQGGGHGVGTEQVSPSPGPPSTSSDPPPSTSSDLPPPPPPVGGAESASVSFSGTPPPSLGHTNQNPPRPPPPSPPPPSRYGLQPLHGMQANTRAGGGGEGEEERRRTRTQRQEEHPLPSGTPPPPPPPPSFFPLPSSHDRDLLSTPTGVALSRATFKMSHLPEEHQREVVAAAAAAAAAAAQMAATLIPLATMQFLPPPPPPQRRSREEEEEAGNVFRGGLGALENLEVLMRSYREMAVNTVHNHPNSLAVAAVMAQGQAAEMRREEEERRRRMGNEGERNNDQ